jgi:putative hydrolase of HD superfamily
VAVDALKGVERRSYIADGTRHENTAEHSWHLALMAIVLAEHAVEEIDLLAVVTMVVIHDLVEIHAGDTYIYDSEGRLDKAQRESAAADVIYGILPGEQGDRLHAVWREFEERRTPEARFAATMDRLEPLLLAVASEGRSWRENAITVDQVRALNEQIDDIAPALKALAVGLTEEAAVAGLLGPPRDG